MLNSRLLKVFLVVFLCCWGAISKSQNCGPSPQLTCLSVLNNGNVQLSWHYQVPPVNFVQTYIYSSSNKQGPFKLIDSVASTAITTYTDASANANNGSMYYYLQASCGNTQVAANSDTLTTMYLIVNNTGNGTAQLHWNAMRTPNLTTASQWYSIYMEYPVGTWTEIDSTKSLSLIDTITICQKNLTLLSFKIEMQDSTGCTSVSSLAGGDFKNSIAPALPFLDSVSVQYPNGNVQIGWNAINSPNTEGYLIYQNQNGKWVCIDTVLGVTTTSYTTTSTSALIGAETFCIASYNCVTTPSVLGDAQAQTTLFLQCEPNPCARINTIKWNKYQNMGTGIKSYDFYMSTNGGPLIQQAVLPADSTIFIQTGMQQSFSYCYLVIARDNSGLKSSSSQQLCYTATIPPEPLFSYLSTATVLAPNVVQVKSYVDINAEIKKYKVVRAVNSTGPYNVVGYIPFNKLNPNVSFNDSTPSTSVNSYYYKTIAVDTCNNDTTQTNIGQTILLTAVANGDLTNTLTWNDYQSWLGGVVNYQIYRINDSTLPATLIATVPYTGSGSNNYIDNVSAFFNEQGVFTYYIVAQEGPGNTYGLQETSTSNLADALQNANVYIPNAFVPDGKNKIFIPVIAYVEKKNYSLRIFNRWGEQVFQTNDPTVGWDGTANSHKCPEDVYIYILQFQMSDGQYIERKGSVALLR